MIKLKRLELNNFLSHKETKLAFGDNDKLLIDGKSGSGKSSIVEAVLWGLYGKGRSDNRSLIRRGQKSASVLIELENLRADSLTKTTYIVERSITASGRHNLTIQFNERSFSQVVENTAETVEFSMVPVNGVKELQDYLEKEILQSSYTLFVNSIVYPQENYENFVNQTAGRRKEIILEIAKADQYDTLYIKTREKITKLETEKAKLDSEFEVLAASIIADGSAVVDLESLTASLSAVEAELASVRAELTGLEDKRTILQSHVTIYNETRRRAEGIEPRRSLILQNIEEDKGELATLSIPESLENDKKDVEILQESARAVQTWTSEMLKISQNRPIDRQYEVKIEELNQDFIKFSDLSAIDECPEVHKKCPILVKERRERLDSIAKDIEKYRDLHDRYMKDVVIYEESIKNLGRRPEFDEARLNNLLLLIKSAEKVMSRKVELEAKIKALEASLEAIEAESEALKAELVSLEDKSQELADLAGLITGKKGKEVELSTLCQETKTKLALASAAAERIKKSEDRMGIVKDLIIELHEKLEWLELLKEAFSPRGIKTIIIDFVLPRLEEKINEILHQLSDFTVRLDTQKGSVKGDKNIEGLFITIYNEQGESFDFNNYSGGEKLKITVAISEALSEIQSFSFRFLDELFIGLDEDSTEDFAKILKRLHGRFSQFFCISHLRNIKDLFPNKLTAVKTSGVTKMQ